METTTSESNGTGVLVLPGRCIEGVIRVPGSKSLAQRHLLAAFLAQGRTQVEGVPECGDVEALLRALRGLAGDEWGQDGAHEGGAWAPREPLGERTTLSAGESGTAARFLTACLAFGGPSKGPVHLVAEGSLALRRSRALIESLVGAGASLRSHSATQTASDVAWPMDIDPVACPEQLTLRDPASSQEISALLFALAARGGGCLTVSGSMPSEPYIRMTESVLADFGVQVDEADGLFSVTGRLRAPAHPLVVEPDASAAAVVLAAGCISGGAVRIPGLTSSSTQGDLRIIDYLGTFGCHGKVDSEGAMASGIPGKGGTLNLSGEPDLAPVLAVVAAMACFHSGEPSLLEGLGTLEGKESPRLSGLAQILRRVGWQVRAGADWLSVDAAPVRQPEGGGPLTFDSMGDHRMAFAGALLGLAYTGIRITGSECVGKSYPNFWTDLAQAGANIRA